MKFRKSFRGGRGRRSFSKRRRGGRRSKSYSKGYFVSRGGIRL